MPFSNAAIHLYHWPCVDGNAAIEMITLNRTCPFVSGLLYSAFQEPLKSTKMLLGLPISWSLPASRNRISYRAPAWSCSLFKQRAPSFYGSVSTTFGHAPCVDRLTRGSRDTPFPGHRHYICRPKFYRKPVNLLIQNGGRALAIGVVYYCNNAFSCAQPLRQNVQS